MELDKPVSNALTDDFQRERKLSFLENLYLPEIFRGLWYSFKQMFAPTFTMNYPEEKWDPPSIFRGRPVLVEDNGKERCVACGLCARACPPLAISMQANEDEEDPKERYPDFFEINMLRCIYCGYCEEVCPEEAIVMSKEHDLTFQHRDEAIFGLDRLLVPKEFLADRLAYLERQKNQQFGQHWDFKRENNIHTLRNRLDYAVEEAKVEAKEMDPAEEPTPAEAAKA